MDITDELSLPHTQTNDASLQLLAAFVAITSFLDCRYVVVIQLLHLQALTKFAFSGEAVVDATVDVFVHHESLPYVCMEGRLLIHLLDTHISHVPCQLRRFAEFGSVQEDPTVQCGGSEVSEQGAIQYCLHSFTITTFADLAFLRKSVHLYNGVLHL